jgi:Putative integral membrane protein, with calcineu rin-like phosphoesterase domain
LDKAFKGAKDADVKILLSHDPSHWEKVVIPGNYNIDLSLSGHTHGFQFGIETKEMKWSPAKYMYKQWAGLYEDDEKLGRYIYVNRGLGSIGYPGRIGILPEITLIELAS